MSDVVDNGKLDWRYGDHTQGSRKLDEAEAWSSGIPKRYADHEEVQHKGDCDRCEIRERWAGLAVQEGHIV